MSELSEDVNSVEAVSEASKIFDLISQLNSTGLKESRQMSKIPRFGVLLKQEQVKKNQDSSTHSSPRQDNCASRSSRVERTSSAQSRALSVFNSSSLLNKTRSLSSQPSTDNLSMLSDRSDKKVRYVVKHRPRASNVKIFSQKVELKNVKSKINSLDKANYVPGGGNVVVS
ncbi:microtubule-associated 4 [Brachionus plicatilis]|uniref:Microtubule-associated 4 n=1 Tax=Brachionus plicatilis TaxID=10195 RepID=A0A3M7S4V4_BRAPC|nr:microtubule-associated 4 [Brachionus plicatilis]